MKRILFHPVHLQLLEPREIDRATLALPTVQQLLQNVPEGNAVTLVYDGRIICCAGFNSPFPGMADVWMISSIYVSLKPFAFVREIERYLVALAKTFSWTRIQTVTRKDEFHQRWMQALGFEEEGTLKNYFRGQDFIMSARYFEVKQ